MKMYRELAAWWPLLSPVENYAEEAAIYAETILQHTRPPVASVLELGSGGGNNAFHLKQRFAMTLVDLSEDMLEISRRINPACRHVKGDMRTVRLGSLFDAVFIHDAIDYMTTRDDLQKALDTAFVHCRAGGTLVVVPDHLKESFQEETDHGGVNGSDYSLRYLEWTWDPNPKDTTCLTEYAFLLRSPDGSVDCFSERHEHGLFSKHEWIDLIEDVGFIPQIISFGLSDHPGHTFEMFLGKKPSV